MAIMTHAKFHFNWLMLTLIFGIWASEPPPPPGPGERLKRPGLIGLIYYWVSQKKCIQCFIKGNSQNKTKILTKCYVSVYQRANSYFDILLEIFGANLAEIVKFKKRETVSKMVENSKKCCIKLFLKMTPGYSRLALDDNADGGQGRSDFNVVFTMSLCPLELKQFLISLLFQIIRF